MSLLISFSILLILALIVIISATRKNTEKANRVDRAKIRAELRSNAKDVWATAVPIKTLIHTDEPIDYVPAIHVEDDVSDSQYQILKAIFADIEPSTPAKVAQQEADYWRDTEPGSLK
jgi:hypothetical protein